MNESDRATRTEEVWRRFRAPLEGFLRARLSDGGAAEDVLQDVFIKVHANIHTLRDDERIQSWLFRIARNAIADCFRARSRSLPLEEISAAGSLENETPAGEAGQKLAAALLEMIDELPPSYRDALRLTEIEGLTQAEMAGRLDISLSAGKSRVQRGREKLKKILLDCCEVELDGNGAVVAYERRNCCCGSGESRTKGDA